MQLRHGFAFKPHEGVAPETERPLALVLGAEVEPACEAHRAVDHDDFPVVAEVHLTAEDRQRDRHERAAVYPRRLEILHEGALQAPASDGVVEQPHLDAALRRVFEQRADTLAELVAAHDKKFHVYVVFRRGESLFNRGKSFASVD